MRGFGSGFARADVEEIALGIDRRRSPNGRARGTPKHFAVAAVADRFRILHRVRSPQSLTCGRIESADSAVCLAALVIVATAESDLILRDRHENLVFVDDGSAGRQWICVESDVLFPNAFAGLGVDHVRV